MMTRHKLCLIWLLIGCGRNSPLPPGQLLDHQLPSAAQSAQAILGKGYNTEQERFAGDCVVGSVDYVGAQESSLRFERSLSEKEISDSLGFSVGAKARYGLLTMSAAADFATSTASDAYSESTIYAAHYRFKNAKLAYKALSPIGLKALGGNSQGSYTWEQWEQTCGHEYVEQIELGAKLFISAKIEFASREDKMNFAAQFKIKGPAFSASAELKKASRTFGRSAAVYIQALQLGGDVRQLSRIFGSSQASTVNAQEQGKVHALLVCSMTKLDACTQVLDHALSYATDLGQVHSFPNQIKPDTALNDPNGPAQLAYITKPWADLAFYAPPPLIASLVLEARKQVAAHWEETLKLKRRVESLLTGPFRLTLTQRSAIDALQSQVTDSLQLLYDTAMVCYQQPEHCVAQTAALQDKLPRLTSAEALSIRPESFAQWCDAYQAKALRRATATTVSRLLTLAAAEGELDSGDDRCAAAEAMLTSLNRLDLSEQSLQDLSPLASLTQLELVNLNGNSLESITPLRALRALRYLYLNKNLLTDLSPLAELPELRNLQASANLLQELPSFASSHLRQLRVADNKLSSLAPLATQSSLQELAAAGNRLVDLTPLSALTGLRELDLSFNRIADFTPLLTLPDLQHLGTAGNPASCPAVLASVCRGGLEE